MKSKIANRGTGPKPCPKCGGVFHPNESKAWAKNHCSVLCEYKAHAASRSAA